jgi:hypothetical protein
MKSKEANQGHPFYYTTIHSSLSQEKKRVVHQKRYYPLKKKYVHTLLLKWDEMILLNMIPLFAFYYY